MDTAHRVGGTLTVADQHHISFGEHAFLEILLAGVEAFVGATREKGAPEETIGHLWGYRTARDGAIYYRIEHVSVSALAERTPDSVCAHTAALPLKRDICHWLRPDLVFLGDFHTHPYTSISEANAAKGWQFSYTDAANLAWDDDYWQDSETPLMVVLAIAPLQRVHSTNPTQQKSNVWRFDIFDHRFWLSPSIGQEVEENGRAILGNANAPVHLWPPPLDVRNWSEHSLAESV